MGGICTRIADKSSSDMHDRLSSMLQEKIGLAIPSFLRQREIVNIDRSFPTGVIIEIMSRLPIKTLARCQVVCKDWLALIDDRYFTDIYLERGKVISHWFNTTSVPSNDNQQSTRSSDPLVYKSACNGLVLIMSVNAKKHYVWNPAIRRALELPDPHEASIGFAFSYVPATESYRIVSFYMDRKSLCCQVLTPGDKAWRPLEVPEIAKSFNNKGSIQRDSVVSSGGAVHYVLVTEVGNKTNIGVLSLDLETERFTFSRFPVSSVAWKNYWDLDWDGKLGFAYIVGENLEVVELEDYKSGRWCENKIVVHLDFPNRSNAYPLFVMRGVIWFWLKDEKIFSYTIQTRRYADVMAARGLSLWSKTFPYKPSLISFEGMVPDTMFERLRPSSLS